MSSPIDPLADTGQDLHRFMAAYAEHFGADLLVVRDSVGRDQDVTALVWALAAQGRHPALKFERVQGLDAIDGTPVLDIKPYVRQFGPQGDVRQPAWMDELMASYWQE